MLGSAVEAHLLNKRCCRCAISQDSDGRLWLTSDGMLVRDGEGLDADVLWAQLLLMIEQCFPVSLMKRTRGC